MLRICLAAILLNLLAPPARAEPLLVFAAASLAGPLDHISQTWDGGEVAISYAGSAALARQIEAGAPADIVILANAAWMERLEERGLVDAPHALLGNRLVLVGPIGAETHGNLADALTALPRTAHVATGFVEAVPAGIYARQALEALGLFADWQGRLVQTDNVRIALALAARGDVDRAITYRTDALAEPRVAIVAEVPASLHDPIRYPMARIRTSTDDRAPAFLAHLQAPEAAAIFADAGFEVLP